MKPENTTGGQWLGLSPLDTLFFRGAERFDAEAGGGSYLNSLFPPHPGTLFAAFNSVLLKAHALHAATERDLEHEDGARSRSGHTHSRGPWLYHKNKLLFPMPAALLAKKEESKQLHRLYPSSAVYQTDLSRRNSANEVEHLSLPHAPTAPKGVKAPENAWLSREGYQKWLNNEVPAPEEWFRAKDLWSIERHTGLERGMENRAAVDGMLYSAAHIRLSAGTGLVLYLPNSGSEATKLLPKHIALGGEGRAVRIDDPADWKWQPVWPEMPQLEPTNGKLRYTLSLFTPGLGAKWGVAPGSVVQEGVPGKIVCCALGRPLRIGGFDTVRNQPERIRSARAAGSVWWMEADASKADDICKLHNTCIGAATNQGYGHVMVGAW